MRRVAALALGAGLALSAPPAWAQDAELSTRETRALMHAYAKCVVGRQAKRASEAIAANAPNRTIVRNYPQLIIGDCLVRQSRHAAKMRFGGDLYRYALADALVARELASGAAPDFSAAPRLDHRDPGPAPTQVGPGGRKLKRAEYEAAVESHNEDSAFAFISRYGECVVRARPAEARALLGTAPDSTEESARFTALRPALARCLSEGQTLSFGRTVLRGTIAVNYYRLALAARAIPAGGGV